MVDAIHRRTTPLQWPTTADETVQEAKKVAVQNPLLTQDSLVSYQDPEELQLEAVAGASRPGKRAEAKGLHAFKDTISVAEPEQTSRAIDNERGVAGGFVSWLYGLGQGIRGYFLRRPEPSLSETAAGRFSSHNPFEATALSEERFDREYERLQRDLNRLFSTMEALREEMKASYTGLDGSSDAIFMVLMKLLMEGKTEDFHRARVKLAENYKKRGKHLDKRFEELQKLRHNLSTSGLWGRAEKGVTYVSMAALTLSATAMLASTGGGALPAAALLTPVVLGLLNEAFGDKISQLAGAGSAKISGGDSEQQALYWKTTIGLSLALSQIAAGGLLGASQNIGMIQFATQTAQAIGSGGKAWSDYSSQRTKGALMGTEEKLRLASEELTSGGKKLSKELVEAKKREGDLIKQAEQLYELIIEITRGIGA